MLILTRRIDEALMIGDDIEIRILDIIGCQAKIGINAPREIAVHREEVYERIQRQKEGETLID